MRVEKVNEVLFAEERGCRTRLWAAVLFGMSALLCAAEYAGLLMNGIDYYKHAARHAELGDSIGLSVMGDAFLTLGYILLVTGLVLLTAGCLERKNSGRTLYVGFVLCALHSVAMLVVDIPAVILYDDYYSLTVDWIDREPEYLKNAVCRFDRIGLYVIMIFILLTVISAKAKDFRSAAYKAWFVPGAAMATGNLNDLIWYLSEGISEMESGYTNELVAMIAELVLLLIMPAALLLCSRWLTLRYADDIPKTGRPDPAYGAFDLSLHALMLVFIPGVWLLLWSMQVTRLLNTEGEKYRSPFGCLLLCAIVPFYAIRWIYVSAKRIDRLAAGNGMESNLTGICTVLSLFITVVPPVLMQEKINTIAVKEKSKQNTGETAHDAAIG